MISVVSVLLPFSVSVPASFSVLLRALAVPQPENSMVQINYLLVSSADNFCNSSNPDQAQQYVRPDLDPNYFNTLMVFLK